MLKEQRKVAAAGLEAARAASATAQNTLDIAQAQYQQQLEAALAAGRSTRLQDWFAKDQQQFDQPNWYFTRQEQIAAVQGQIDEAQKGWEDAQAQLDSLTKSLEKSDFLTAEQRVLKARVAYLVAKDVNQRAQNSADVKAPQGRYNRTHCGSNDGYHLADNSLVNILYGCTGDANLTDVSQQMFDDAEAELKDAQNAYDGLLTTKAAEDVLSARAAVAVAQERYYAGLDRLSALQTGDQAPVVTAAQGAVDQAQAAYEQSQKAVAQAQAAADAMLPPGKSWIWNQCLLDLGATVCRARTPRCGECPLAEACAWRGAGDDPAIGSAGVSGRQARFDGSDRQARGRILARLLDGAADEVALQLAAGRGPLATRHLVESLRTDGLVVVDAELNVRLP